MPDPLPVTTYVRGTTGTYKRSVGRAEAVSRMIASAQKGDRGAMATSEQRADAPRDAADFAWPSRETSECPFPFYETLRREAPVYKLPDRNEYLVSRWEEIAHIELHPE